MDTCFLLRVSAWLITLIDLSYTQIYSSIPLQVFTLPSPYPWSSLRAAPHSPLGRKLVTYSDYPSDILVQSNSIYYPPNSNALPRNYFLRNPIPGKSPIIFRPTSLHRHPIPIRYEFSRVGNSLKTKEIPKDSRRAGFVLDNTLGLNVAPQSSEAARVWESKAIPVKPFPFSVYDASREESKAAEYLEPKVGSSATPNTEDATKAESKSELHEPPAEISTLPDAADFATQEPQQFYKKEKNGRVIFGFHTKEQTRMESRDEDAKVYGAYTYFDPTGNPVRMQYWDEGKGFHAAGNMLPQSIAALPEVVTDTPEVQAAKKLHHKLPTPDNGSYEEIGSSDPKPAVSEDDNDELIIDSEKLPDSEFPPANSNIEDGKSNDVSTQTEQTAEQDSTPSPTKINPTPNAESLSDPESVVIENPEFKKLSKRSIDESHSGRKTARHHAFFNHDFTGNVPFPQLPFFPAYSVLPARRVITTPHFRPSQPEIGHPIPGKFAPVKTDVNVPYLSKTSTLIEPMIKLSTPFSDVAHRFQELLHSKTPVIGPTSIESDSFPPLSNEEFTHVFVDQSDAPPSSGYAEEPHPWLTAPSAPEAFKDEFPGTLKNKQKLDSFSHNNNFNSFPPNKFNSEIPATDFHVKDGIKKGDFFGSNLFSSFSSGPPLLTPLSSQTVIRTDLSDAFKYHSPTGFPKVPLSYHISHFDDSNQFHFSPHIPFSRPFIGHDYTLVDKNFPSSNAHLYFPYVPSEFPHSGQFPSVNIAHHDLPNISATSDKPFSETKGDSQKDSKDHQNDKKPEGSSSTGEHTTEGLKIVVADVPADDEKKETTFSSDGGNAEPSTVKPTEISEVNESTDSTGESTESTNESVETTESSEVSESEVDPVETSVSNEAESSDSSLVIDTRLSAEESAFVVESITEISTEAATETPGNETQENEVRQDKNEAGKGASIGNEVKQTENGDKAQKIKPEIKSPEGTGELTNVVRRDAELIALQRNTLRAAEVHDVQLSSKQRHIHYKIAPVSVK